VEALRGRVWLWNTFNEPDTYASLSFVLGQFPPFRKARLGSFRTVVRNMAEAHEKICRIIRADQNASRPPAVGFSKNWTFFQPYHRAAFWDRGLAALNHAVFNRFVLSQFMGGARRRAGTYLGLNYYGRVRFRNFRPLAPVGNVSPQQLAKLNVQCDDMFERYPTGMEFALLQLHRHYGLPFYITEHGEASRDENFRARDLKANLAGLHRAMGRGVDVRGFFYWSLMDNFEWQFGYTKKFGLVHVNFDDGQFTRTMKPLGQLYRQICLNNSVEL